MIEAVIFDMDGLILDSEIIESQALIKFLTDNGIEPKLNPNGLIHEIGGGKDHYIKFKTKYSLPHDTEEIKKVKRAHFELLIKKGNLKVYDGFYELLRELKKNNFKVAVASNRNIENIYLILDTLEVTDEFDVLVGAAESGRFKPHPDIYLEAANKLDIKPNFCLALEDTDRGIESAKAAGMKVIAVPNEYTREHDFSKADKVVKSLKSVTIELIKTI